MENISALDLIMERMDWLNSLRALYNKLSQNQPENQQVNLQQFLDHLRGEIEGLPLVEVTEFTRQSSLQYISLYDILSSFETEKEVSVDWDFIMNRVILVKVDQLTEAPIQFEENWTENQANNEQESFELPEDYFYKMKTAEIPRADESYCEIKEKTKRQNEIMITTLDLSKNKNALEELGRTMEYKGKLMYLTIAGCKLTEIPSFLPASLQLLNIADNRITQIRNLHHLSSLKFLNISVNKISKIGGIYRCKELRELLISCNELRKVTNLFENGNIQLLDISYNHFTSYEALAALGNNRKLEVLELIGNPICRQPHYKSIVKGLVTSIQHVDTRQVIHMSSFEDFESFAFAPLTGVYKEVRRSRIFRATTLPHRPILSYK